MFPKADAEVRALATCVLVPAFACTSAIVADRLGGLTAGRIALVLGAAAAIALAASRIAPAEARTEAGRSALPPTGLALLLGAAFGPWALRTVALGTGFQWDDLTYHAAVPAHWLQTQSLVLPAFSFQVYYPFVAELTALWLTLPLGVMSQANLAIFLWACTAVAAIAVLARATGASPLLAGCAAAALLVSPKILSLAGTFSANDLAAAAFGIAALAFAAPPRNGSVAPALSGVAVGLALGTKASMAPLALVLVGWFALPTADASPGRRARDLSFFAIGAVLSGAYWYLENIRLTGNPLFPAEIGPFAGPLVERIRWQTSLAGVLAVGEPGLWREALVQRLDWPTPLGLLALLGYATGAVRIVLPKGGDAPAARAYLALLLLAGALAIALHPYQPFSGTVNRPSGGGDDPSRYLVFPFAIGLVLLAAAAPRARGGRALIASLVLLAISYTAVFQAAAGTQWAMAAGATLALLLSALGRRLGAGLGVRARTAAPYVLVSLLFGVLALVTPLKTRWSEAELVDFGGTRPVGAGWRALDALPAGARVTSFTMDASSHNFYYPLFGASLALVPVGVDHAGARRRLLHEEWRDEPQAWWWEFSARGEPVAPKRLARNLGAAAVDYVLVSRWMQPRRGDRWPPQRKALETLGAKRIYGDGYSEIYDVQAIRSIR